MLIYIIVLILIAIFSLYPMAKMNSQQSKRIFLCLSFTIMAFVLGARGNNVGEDTNHYLTFFNQATNVGWDKIFDGTSFRSAYYTNQFGEIDTIENGFIAIAKVVHWFTSDGQIFLFIIAIFTCTLFAKFIYDNSDDAVFSTFIFLCESMFMLAFNGARQILAVAITLQAYTFLKNKKWKSAIMIILCASLIHNVALIGFALFPIMLIKTKKEYKLFKYAIIFTFISPFMLIFSRNLIGKLFPRYAIYFVLNYWENSLGGIAILWIVEFILIFIAYKKKFKTTQSFNTSCLVLMYLVFELMGLQITIFSRIGWFFRPYLLIFFPSCKVYFSKNTWKLVQGLLMILMILLYLSYAGTPARSYSFYW